MPLTLYIFILLLTYYYYHPLVVPVLSRSAKVLN